MWQVIRQWLRRMLLPLLGLALVLSPIVTLASAGHFSRPPLTTDAAGYPPLGYPLSLPLFQNNYSPASGISGRVTLNGTPAPGVPLELSLYDGSNWQTIATTSTASNASYSFTGAPGLFAGQSYYVVFHNPAAAADGRLAYWYTRGLRSYSAGSAVEIGNFDLADVGLSSPPPGALVALPFTFQWTSRPATPTDRYEVNLFDPLDESRRTHTDPSPGDVNGFTLPGGPAGLSTSVQYGWYVGVLSPDGGYGASFHYRLVAFSNAGLISHEQAWSASPVDRLVLPGQPHLETIP